jgi:hypothetical protein
MHNKTHQNWRCLISIASGRPVVNLGSDITFDEKPGNSSFPSLIGKFSAAKARGVGDSTVGGSQRFGKSCRQSKDAPSPYCWDLEATLPTSTQRQGVNVRKYSLAGASCW